MMQVRSSSAGLTAQEENFWQFLTVFLPVQRISLWQMLVNLRQASVMLTERKWGGGTVCYMLKLHLFTQLLAPAIIKIMKYKSAQQLFCAQLSFPIPFEPLKEELVVPAQPPFPASKASPVMLKWCAMHFSLGRVSLASFLPCIFVSSDMAAKACAPLGERLCTLSASLSCTFANHLNTTAQFSSVCALSTGEKLGS